MELIEDVANLRKEVAYNTAMLQNIANGGVHEDNQNIFDVLKLPLCNMAHLLQLEKTLENEIVTTKKLVSCSIIQLIFIFYTSFFTIYLF